MDRRRFLKTTAMSALGASVGVGVGGCDLGPGPLEGVYSDRFTYRWGEQIRIHLAVQSSDPIDVDCIRIDRTPVLRHARFTVVPTRTQRTVDPGRWGAGFDVAVEFPASDLPPGLYHLSIDPARLQPENRTNTWNAFPTQNTLPTFVVTDAVPGSRSRLLLVHDTLTPLCYDSFGDRSIYPLEAAYYDVSLLRPGASLATYPIFPMRTLHDAGFEFEYVDLVALHQAPLGFLDAYDCVFLIATHEYQTHETMTHFAHFLEGGGNLVCAANEFGCFRVRLNGMSLSAYKWRAVLDDPSVQLAADLEAQDPELARRVRARIAGVGMNGADTPWETEITGQSVWMAHRVSPQVRIDMQTHDHPEVGWLFEGTGFTAGDVLPRSIREFATGNRIDFDDFGRPFVPEPGPTRTPDDLIVWGSTPSQDGRDWTWAPMVASTYWPRIDCHALGSLQLRSSGAQVVTFPSNQFVHENAYDPAHQRLLVNVFDRLSVRA